MQDESMTSGARKQLIEVKLADGTAFFVRAEVVSGETNVGNVAPSFEAVMQAVEGVGRRLNEVWKNVGPSRASVEFGVELAYDAGKVLALFVDASTTASMKITLEWGKPPAE